MSVGRHNESVILWLWEFLRGFLKRTESFRFRPHWPRCAFLWSATTQGHGLISGDFAEIFRDNPAPPAQYTNDSTKDEDFHRFLSLLDLSAKP
jgi:hypothetical protein